MTTLLDIRDLTVTFSGKAEAEARHGRIVPLPFPGEGESLSIIGESGSGKTTLMRAILGHVQPSEGSLRLFGTDVTLASDDEIGRLKRRCALVSPGTPLWIPPSHPHRHGRRSGAVAHRPGPGHEKRGGKTGTGNCWKSSVSATKTSSPPGCASPSREASASGSPSPGR